MAGSVIQATGTVEFKDSLRTGVIPEAAGALVATASSLGLIPNLSGGAGWYWRWSSCHKVPFPDQTQILPNSTQQWC